MSFGCPVAAQRDVSYPDSDVDIALALMPAERGHDWALGAYFALASNGKRELYCCRSADAGTWCQPRPDRTTDAAIKPQLKPVHFFGGRSNQ